jgi:hypothetical protein
MPTAEERDFEVGQGTPPPAPSSEAPVETPVPERDPAEVERVRQQEELSRIVQERELSNTQMNYAKEVLVAKLRRENPILDNYITGLEEIVKLHMAETPAAPPAARGGAIKPAAPKK